MIYFLRAEQDSAEIKAGWIKIGVTRKLSERIGQIAIEIGHKPTLLAVMGGMFLEEWKVHQRFAERRRFGEWFEPDASLLTFIDENGREWNGVDDPTPVRQPSYEELPICDGTVLAENLIRLGSVRQTVAIGEVAKIVSERTGRPMSRQRLSGLLNSIRIRPEVIEVLAKALNVSPEDLMIR